MSEHPVSDDATFRLASGEELVVPHNTEATRPSVRDRRTAGRLRARKVRRLVRHVEPWSVLKVSLLFYFCLWVLLLIAGVILWSFAVGSGTIDNVENFVTELFALQTFSFNADEIFRASAIGGLVLVVAGSGFTVLMAVLFNLISDVTGGVRFTVVEEETARPRPKRTRPRRVAEPAISSATAGLAIPRATPRPMEVPEGSGSSGAADDTFVDAPGAGVPILRTAEGSVSGESPA